jgi:thiol-disulfide isomerase/thioredoxin
VRHASVLALLLSVAPLACSGTKERPPQTADAKKASAKAQRPELALGELLPPLPDTSELRPVGMDDGPVPGFRVRATDGRVLDSTKLVGNEPFIVFFFATWCSMCSQKMPHVRRALEATGPVKVIGVSLDEDTTWPQASGYLREHGVVNVPLVRGADYPRFALSYNPFSMIPLVVVVGKNGGLVDFQMGFAENDQSRLVAAVELARKIGPLAPPREHRPEPEPVLIH